MKFGLLTHPCAAVGSHSTSPREQFQLQVSAKDTSWWQQIKTQGITKFHYWETTNVCCKCCACLFFSWRCFTGSVKALTRWWREVKSQGSTRVIHIHSPLTTSVTTNLFFHGNPSNNWFQSGPQSWTHRSTFIHKAGLAEKKHFSRNTNYFLPVRHSGFSG